MNSPVVAYQGVPGAYSHEALLELGRRVNLEFQPYSTPSFRNLFDAINQDDIGVGLVPFENSIHGIVFPALDELLGRNNLEIIGEIYFRVNHCLLGNPLDVRRERELSTLRGKTVHSHWQAIGQCHNSIARLGMTSKEYDDTAGAAEWVSRLRETDEAFRHYAIASERAAELYNLEVITRNLQDTPDNTTRFIMTRRKGILDPELDNIFDRTIRDKFKVTLTYQVSMNNEWEVGKAISDYGFRRYTSNNRPLRDNSVRNRRGEPKIFSKRFITDVGVPYDRVGDIDDLIGSLSMVNGISDLKVLGIYPKDTVMVSGETSIKT